MEKSPDAFRTISEVADHLATPAHVLRFWESRFPQIRPVKRAGGRRYYRPSDVALLSGIRRLLHDEGLTIRGVQKLLREQGVRHVAGLASAEPEEAGAWIDAPAAEDAQVEVAALPPGPAEAASPPETAFAETVPPAVPPTSPPAAPPPLEELPLFAALQAAPEEEPVTQGEPVAAIPAPEAAGDATPLPAPPDPAPDPGPDPAPDPGPDPAADPAPIAAAEAPPTGLAMPPSAPLPDIDTGRLLAVLRAGPRGGLAGDARVVALGDRLAALRALRGTGAVR